MTDDMVGWLRRQLDEIEGDANAILWDGSGNQVRWDEVGSATIDIGTEAIHFGDRTIKNHVMNHDPASVLADIKAKREIVLMYEAAALSVQAATGTVLAGGTKVNLRAYGSVVRQLAQAYAHRPGYQEGWRP